MIDSRSITCRECQSRLDEFALNDLPAEACDAIAKHLASGCPECNQLLSDIASDFGQLALTLPLEAPPMRGERALLNRIAVGQLRQEAARPTMAASPAPTIPARSSSRGLWAAAIALAAMIVGIAAWTSRHNNSENVAGQGSWVELDRRVAEADAGQRFSTIPQLRFASLKLPAQKVSVEGYVVQDRLAKQWHVYAFHLPTLPTGRVHQLWFDLGDSHFARAGIADTDGDGALSCIVNAPSDRSSIRGIAISDEPNAGSDSPSGESLVESLLP